MLELIQDIWKKLKADFEYVTGKQFIGLVASLNAGFASRIADFSSKLGWIEKQAFIATADRDYLYLNMGQILPPESSEIATGTVVFYGAAGTSITLGLAIKDDDNEYEVTLADTIASYSFSGNVTVVGDKASLPANTEVPSTQCYVNGVLKDCVSTADEFSFAAGTLTDGESVTVQVNKSGLVPVKCTEAGESGNRDLSDQLKMKTTVEGINKDVGVVSIEGGEDEEDVEDYRARCLYWFSHPQAPFSENHIVDLIKRNMDTIKYAWVKGGDTEEGLATVYAINYNYTLTSDELVEMNILAQSIRPAQMDSSKLTVQAATVDSTTVAIADLVPSNSAMQEAVTNNIEYLFDTDLWEIGVTEEAILSAIYRTEVDGERVTSVGVVTGAVPATPLTFWKLDGVTFS